jgi:hypothetical protein
MLKDWMLVWLLNRNEMHESKEHRIDGACHFFLVKKVFMEWRVIFSLFILILL